jgi:hypothetical protein
LFDLITEKISRKERIAILFKEYDTLRAEIIARAETQRGYLTIGGSAAGAILAFGGQQVLWNIGDSKAWFVLLGSAIALGCGVIAAFLSYRHTAVIGKYLRVIENKINDLAGGESLLGWENDLRGELIVPAANPGSISLRA